MRLEYLSKSDVEKIQEATLVLLEKTGIRSGSERFLNKAKEVGLTVNDGVVYFPRDLVKKGLSTVPSHFTLYGIDESKQIHIGEKRAYSQTCVGTPSIMGIDTNKSEGVTLKDLEDFVRVAEGGACYRRRRGNGDKA